MKPTYTYFHPDNLDSPIDSYSLALAAIERNNLIIDCAYLPVLEAAHRGCVSAVCEMATLFGSGAPGLPKNYTQAQFYTDVIKGYNKGDPETEVEAIYNSGCLAFRFGNFEKAKTEFIEAAKIMVNNLPPEKWGFGVFDRLRQLDFPTTEGNNG